ncbi:MAG: bifunctional DNA-formamidopyrimidine glycosylase/DNA-(apurinic or apyrimidinic site) lyase [Planctomycetota bacterium]
MPELPEVETIVRTCRPRLEGRRIRAFQTTWRKTAVPSPAVLRRNLAGRTITALSRRAKFIVFHLDDGAHVLVHLRMSGRFEWAGGNGCSDAPALNHGPKQPAHASAAGFAHVRAWWDLDSGDRLLFCDARKFGRIVYTRDLAAATAVLGPEPLDRSFTPAALAGLLRARRRQLKPLLLDQTVIAGLGNIYTDEALFCARLHPLTPSDRLSDAAVIRLHRAVRDVLRRAIRNHGTTIDWIYPDGWMQRKLLVYGRTGAPCRRCGRPIAALRVAQRGTHICPRCQPPPPPAAYSIAAKREHRNQ